MAAQGPPARRGTRCGCGRPVEVDHRYCPACGSLVGHLDPDDGEAGPGGTVPLLLDPVAGPVTETGDVRAERSGLGRRLLVLAGAAVVGLLVWGLFRQPSGEVAPDPSDEEGAAEGDDADERTGGAADDGEGERTTTTGRTIRTTASPRRSTTTAAATPLTSPDGSPGVLLGEETGLSLVIGSVGVGELLVVDLDTGEVTSLGRIRGAPIGQVGTKLVLSGDNGRPSLFDLDDPEAEPIRLVPPGSWGEVVRVTDDLVWMFRERDGGTALVASDAAGREVDEVEGAGDWLDLSRFFGSIGRPPDLISHPTGGLYRRQGGGYRRVASGRVLAVGDRLAVVEDCDEAMSCRGLWYDTETSELVGFPSPPPASTSGLFQLLGGDRWLLHADWRSGTTDLIEVATGRTVRELAPGAVLGPIGPLVTLSGDGRWLLTREDGGPIVVDLDSGTGWPIEVDRPSGDTIGLFIETPA
jgi:hypothetical protein